MLNISVSFVWLSPVCAALAKCGDVDLNYEFDAARLPLVEPSGVNTQSTTQHHLHSLVILPPLHIVTQAIIQLLSVSIF